MTDCTREKSVGTHDYAEVVEAREQCMCLVCAHDLSSARRRLHMADQTTLG